MSIFSPDNFFDLTENPVSMLFENIESVYEAIPKISDFIKQLGSKLNKDVFDEIDKNVWVARTAKIANTASITGPCIICENTEIRHCAFIRGNAFIGKNCVVGNSTEIKNVILLSNVQVPHYNYVGDSILGNFAHMGAGSITSNVKSDKTLVTVKNGNQKIETGLKKFGAVLGDRVEVGCNSVLNPGTIIGKNSNIYPLSSVRGYISENSIYKNSNEVVQKL